ncbi:hypothetical protein [Neptuniibacter sp. QD37_11]|uniref:hypothetical protein n=1 Tax=Neptuniibacter sp. QD37_11 TaxID=3398209 RepID=UPI0039F461F5
MTTISKTDLLFIRACKSAKGMQRVKSVYRRFYLKGNSDPMPHVASILTGIVDAHCPMSNTDLVQALNPAQREFYGLDAEPFHVTVAHAMLSRIANTPVDKFPNYR